MTFLSQARRMGLAVLFAVAATVQAQSPLDVIPADAKVVVLVNNLERTMQGSERFAQAIGQPAPPTDLGPLTQFMGELGSRWKVDRGVALAVMQPGQDGMVAVFPVEDANAALQAVKAEMKGEFGSFDMFGRTVLGAARGKHFLVSEGESTLKAFSGGQSIAAGLTSAQRKMADSNAVFIYFNIPALKPMIEQGFNDGDQLEQLFQRIAKNVPQMQPKQAAEATKRAIKALSEQAKSLYLGFQIDEKAIVTQIGVELLPTSPARAKLGAYKPTGAGLFATLPSSNFVAAFGVDAAGLASMGGDQEGPKVNSVAGAFSLEKDASVFMLRIDSPDAAKLNEQIKGLVGVLQFAVGAQAQGKVEFATNAKKVGGADVGETVVKFKDANPKAQQAVAGILGGNDVVIQHGVVGQSVGMTISGKADAFSALQAGGSLGAADKVKGATGMLPANAAFTLLVDPLNMLQIGKRAARATGQETPIAAVNIPEGGGFPMGLALSPEPDGVILHIAVPAASVRDVAPIMTKID
jgi:hypothetical protein